MSSESSQRGSGGFLAGANRLWASLRGRSSGSSQAPAAPIASEEVSPAPEIRPILSHLADAANLITLTGLLFGVVAITFALNGRFPEAAICLVITFLCDIFDGVVAKRLKNRTAAERAFGAELDSFTDTVTMGAGPAIILISYGGFEAWFWPGAILFLVALLARVSFFNASGGLSDQPTLYYTGVPTDLILLSFVTIMLLDVPLDREVFKIVLYASMLPLAGLMVSPFQVKKLTGNWYYYLPVIAITIAAAHAVRLFA